MATNKITENKIEEEVLADGKYYKSKINKQLDQQDDWVKWYRQRDGLE